MEFAPAGVIPLSEQIVRRLKLFPGLKQGTGGMNLPLPGHNLMPHVVALETHLWSISLHAHIVWPVGRILNSVWSHVTVYFAK